MAPRRPAARSELGHTSEKRVAPEEVADRLPKRVRPPAAQAAKAPSKAAPQPTRAPTLNIIPNPAPTTRLEVFVFGEGSAGELGLGTKNAIDVKAPRLNHNLDAESVGVVSIATGGMHCLALTHDRKVLSWGLNDLHTLGRDTTWDGGMQDEDDSNSDASEPDLNPLESTPTAIPAGMFPADIEIVQVAAGDSASFVLTNEGLVYGWGTFRDSRGVFGFSLQSNKKVFNIQREPLLIPNLKNITQLSVGNDFCLALDADGSVFAWGAYEQCQIGRRLVERHRYSALLPVRVGLPKKKIVSVHAGANHAFAIDLNGDTWAWGSNNFGQTGILEGAGESGGHVIAPTKVKSLVGKNMKMIQGGSHHSIGVNQTGECLVWGRIDGLQMGLDLGKFPLDEPQKVIVERGRPRILLQPAALPIPNCIYAAAGSDHNIAVCSNGKAYSWGFNANYQCGQVTDDDIPVATLMDNSKIRSKKLCWAGAGGQYSMLASAYEDASMADANSLTNGVK